MENENELLDNEQNTETVIPDPALEVLKELKDEIVALKLQNAELTKANLKLALLGSKNEPKQESPEEILAKMF